jgi:hypothetical protein
MSISEIDLASLLISFITESGGKMKARYVYTISLIFLIFSYVYLSFFIIKRRFLHN